MYPYTGSISAGRHIKSKQSERAPLPFASPDKSELENEFIRRSGLWVRLFIIFQFACQIALLFEFFNPLRMYVRSASFGSSLIFLVLLPKLRRQPHPSTYAAMWVLIILVLSLFHPTTNSWLAGGAQVVLYLAILGPLFWVPNLQITVTELRKVLLIIFIFNALSAATGVLQAYFPGYFQPSLSSMITDMDKGYVEGLKITLANGQSVFRPMGLTDIPGGAAAAGFYTVLLGLGFYVTSRKTEARFACLSFITIGLTSIYLSQIRSWLVICALCVLAFCILLAWQRRMSTLMPLLKGLVIAIVLSFTFTSFVGGQSITNRMATLIQYPFSTVYYNNRGIFLEYTIKELLPEYPFGAGLGRWGMTSNYFGDRSDPRHAPIYVEIQWTGWLLDGGVPLILAYVIAILLALKMATVIASNRAVGDLSTWAAIVLAYNVGAIATTFSYPLFIGQSGIQFWLLNALLFAAARTVIPNLGRPEKLRR